MIHSSLYQSARFLKDAPLKTKCWFSSDCASYCCSQTLKVCIDQTKGQCSENELASSAYTVRSALVIIFTVLTLFLLIVFYRQLFKMIKQIGRKCKKLFSNQIQIRVTPPPSQTKQVSPPSTLDSPASTLNNSRAGLMKESRGSEQTNYDIKKA